MKGLLAVLCLLNTGWLSKSLAVHRGLGLSLPQWPRAHAQSMLECVLVHSQQEHRLDLG